MAKLSDSELLGLLDPQDDPQVSSQPKTLEEYIALHGQEGRNKWERRDQKRYARSLRLGPIESGVSSFVSKGIGSITGGTLKGAGILSEWGSTLATNEIAAPVMSWVTGKPADRLDPATEKNVLYQMGESLEGIFNKALPTNPIHDTKFWSGALPQGLGSAVGFIGTGGIIGTVTRGARATQAANVATKLSAAPKLSPALSASLNKLQSSIKRYDHLRGVGIAGFMVNGSEGFEDARFHIFEKARKEGREPTDKELNDLYSTFIINGIGGLSEVVGATALGVRMFSSLDKATGGAWGDLSSNWLGRIIGGAAVEATQESFQTGLLNYTASTLVGYDEGREIAEHVPQAAGVGGAVGAIFGAISMAGGRRARLHQRMRELRQNAVELEAAGSPKMAEVHRAKADEILEELKKDLSSPAPEEGNAANRPVNAGQISTSGAFPRKGDSATSSDEVSTKARNRVYLDRTDPNNPFWVVDVDANATTEEIQAAQAAITDASTRSTSNNLTYEIFKNGTARITDSEGNLIEAGQEQVVTQPTSPARIEYNGIKIETGEVNVTDSDANLAISKLLPALEAKARALGLNPSELTLRLNRGSGGINARANDIGVVDIDVDWFNKVEQKFGAKAQEFFTRAADEEIRHIAHNKAMQSDFLAEGGKEADVEGFLAYRAERLQKIWQSVSEEEKSKLIKARGGRGGVDNDVQLGSEYIRYKWQQISDGKVTEESFAKEPGAIRSAIESLLRYLKNLTGVNLSAEVEAEIKSVEKFLSKVKPATTSESTSAESAAVNEDRIFSRPTESTPAYEERPVRENEKPLKDKLREVANRAVNKAARNGTVFAENKDEALGFVEAELLDVADKGYFDEMGDSEAEAKASVIANRSVTNFLRERLGRTGKKAALETAKSLNEPVPGSEGVTEGDRMQDTKFSTPEEEAAYQDKVKAVGEALSRMDPDLKLIKTDAIEHGGANNRNPRKGEEGTTAAAAQARLDLTPDQYRARRKKADKQFNEKLSEVTGVPIKNLTDAESWAFDPLDDNELSTYDVASEIQRDSVTGARTAILPPAEADSLAKAGMGKERIATNGADFTDAARRYQSAIFQSIRNYGESIANFYGYTDRRKGEIATWALLNNKTKRLLPRIMPNGTVIDVSPELVKNLETLREIIPSIEPDAIYKNLGPALSAGAEAEVFVDKEAQVVYKVLSTEKDGGIGLATPVEKFIAEDRPEFMPSYRGVNKPGDRQTLNDIAHRYRIQNNHGGFVFTEIAGVIEGRGLVVKQRFINGAPSYDVQGNARLAGLTSMSPNRVNEKHLLPPVTFITVDGDRAFVHGDLDGGGNIFIGEKDGDLYLIDVLSRELSEEEKAFPEIARDIERAAAVKQYGSESFAFNPLDIDLDNLSAAERKAVDKLEQDAKKKPNATPRDTYLAVAAMRMRDDLIPVEIYGEIVEERDPWLDKRKDAKGEGVSTAKDLMGFLGVPKVDGEINQIMDYLPGVVLKTDKPTPEQVERTKKKKSKVLRAVKDGTPVEIRIDINAFNNSDADGNPVYVVTIHESSDGESSVGKPISYVPVARIKDFTTVVRFVTDSDLAPGKRKKPEDIAAGMRKVPLATTKGLAAGTKLTPKQMLELLDGRKWIEAGFNPVRSSEFVDVRTGDVILGGDEAVHVGSRIFVKRKGAKIQKKADRPTGKLSDAESYAYDPLSGGMTETESSEEATPEQVDYVVGDAAKVKEGFGDFWDKAGRLISGGYLSVVDTLERIGFKPLADMINDYQIKIGEYQGKLMAPIRGWRRGKTTEEINAAYRQVEAFFGLREDYGSESDIHYLLNQHSAEKDRQARRNPDDRDYTRLNEISGEIDLRIRHSARRARRRAERYRESMSPEAQELLGIIEDTAEITGQISQDLNILVKDGGTYRPMRNLGRKHYPRRFSERVNEVIQSRNLDPALFQSLKDALIRDGVVESDTAAEEYLSSMILMGEMSGGDRMANVELARGVRLPREFYDTSVDGYIDFIYGFSERAAQVQSFGQSTDTETDAFGAAINAAKGDRVVREYLQAVANDVYRRRPVRTGLDKTFERSVSWTGVLYLSGPFTAVRDFVSGVMLTVEQYGISNSAEPIYRALLDQAAAVAEMARSGAKNDWQGIDPDIVIEAENMGAIRDDFLSAQFLDQRLDPTNSIDQKTQLVANKALFFKQQMDRLARGVTMGASLNWLRSAIQIYRNGPNSPSARRRIESLMRLRFTEAQAIQLLEGRAGLVEEFARRSVAEKQYTYSLAQHPLFIGASSPVMKLMFQFQRWSFQRGRDVIRNVVSPAVDMVRKGKTGDPMPLIRFMGMGLLFGELLKWLMELFTDREDRTATNEEILNSDKKAGKIFERVIQNYVFTGATGFLGEYYMMFHELTKRGPRFKDPWNPPLFNLAQDMEGFYRNVYQKGLSIDTIGQEAQRLGRSLPIANQIEGLVRGTHRSLFDTDSQGTWAARRDLFYTRNMARRFGEETGIDVESKFSGQFAQDKYSTQKQNLKEALLIGDIDAARAAKDALLEAGMNRRSLQSVVRSNQPIRIGMQTRDDTQRQFKKWLNKTVPSQAHRVNRIQNRYNQTARKLRLMN